MADVQVVLNASREVVVGKYDSATYKFEPGERKEIRNKHAVMHLVDRWGKYGLIDITWSKALESQYADYELYVFEKEKEALYQIMEMLEESVQNFATYEDECGDKKTVERMRFGKQAEQRKKQLADIKEYITKIESRDTKKIIDDKAADLRRQADELLKHAARLSGDNVNKSGNSSQNRTSRP